MENKKNEIAKQISEVEFYPEILDEKYELTKSTKLPLGDLATMGAAFEPLTSALQYVTGNGGASGGLMRVVIPKGTTLTKGVNVNGYLGMARDASNSLVAQAELHPIPFDPTSVAIAIAIKTITDKLETIQELQEEMLSFLIQKERSELKGDLNFLTDTINNYKFNINNEKYKNHHHIKVLDIKQTSERKIDFYKEQITKDIQKKKILNNDQDVKKAINKLQNEFKDYQLA